MITLIPARHAGVRCAATGAVTKQCPVKHEIDRGQVRIEWLTTTKTVELHSFAAYLKAWAGIESSHEDFVASVRGNLVAAGVDVVSVDWIGDTAGLLIEVTVEK